MLPHFGATRRGLLFGVTVALSVATAGRASSPPSQAEPGAIEVLVARYASGDHAAAREVDGQSVTTNQLTKSLDAWIAAGDPELERRRVMVAAAFALDVVWTASRTYRHEHIVERDPEEGRLSDSDAPLATPFAEGRVAAWAVTRLPGDGEVDTTERTLWLTAVGVAQDARAWRRLEARILPMAHKRLPGEPRVHLAGAVVRSNLALGHLRLVAGTIRRNDILRDEPYPPSSKLVQEAVRGFASLLPDPKVAGEAHLRIGYLKLRARNWTDAITHLQVVRTTAREPFLVSAADYFAGFVHEQQKQPDQAVAAYRRAVAVTPGMRNLSTRLAALLFVQNERAEAYALLEAAQKTRPAPIDLLVALDIADGRFVLEWLAAIRGALR